MRLRTNELFHFIKERHSIYKKRLLGQPKPWTEDTILQQYRFCNVYRELDTVTRWIAKNWREVHRDDPNLWFAMVVARLLNLPGSLATVDYPVPWDAEYFKEACRVRSTLGLPLFNGAYIVGTCGQKGDKYVAVADAMLTPMWNNREIVSEVIHRSGVTLSEVHAVLMRCPGLGGFIAAQVVRDLQYVYPLNRCLDWSTWAASGPGSRRGMNWVRDYPLDQPWKESEWFLNLEYLAVITRTYTKSIGYPPLHAGDLQNCLCELGEYVKVLTGQGRPKAKYDGA